MQRVASVVAATVLVVGLVRSQCFTANDRDAAKSGTSSATHILEGFSNFTFDLYRDICSSSQGRHTNVFFSPVSVWSALVATYLGARNGTATEMAHVLGLNDMDAASVANAYRMIKFSYSHRGANNDANFVFRMANKIFFHLDEPIRQCILEYFTNEVVRVDFAARPELSRQFINQWVEEHTLGKIKELLPAGYVDHTTRMLLVNAAYFKGDWQHQFDETLTKQGQFQVDSGKVVSTPIMKQRETFHYGKNAKAQCTALEIPYSGNELSMLVILPDVGVSVDDVMARLSTPVLRAIVSGMRLRSVSLSLPQFRVEQATDLEGILNHLGIHDLFDPTKADLSGFTGRRDFAVNSVRHKAFVEVNERGTEAAAATSLISFRKGSLPVPFYVDRPFIFLIKDNVLDATLFMGLIRDPTL